jgi:hypothetical protein
VQVEANAARTLVGIALALLRTDIAQKARQQRLVNRLVAHVIDRRQPWVPLHALFRRLARQLPVDVAPFGQAQVRHVPGAACIHQSTV